MPGKSNGTYLKVALEGIGAWDWNIKKDDKDSISMVASHHGDEYNVPERP